MMSVVFAPASLIPPVPIRLRTTFFPYYSVLLSYRGGQEQPDQAARKFLKKFFLRKEEAFSVVPYLLPNLCGTF